MPLGNGHYRNPILYADYSDPDLIRVGDDYYMTASSFNCVPGLPILHSKDLVNWRIINYALRELRPEGADPGYFDKPQHGNGVWAPSIRFHKGEFMIYWGDPDFGIYVVKTKNIRGQWDKPVLVLPGKGLIDPSPLFDNDGRVYLVHAWAHSRAGFNAVLMVCELDQTGTTAVSNPTLVFDGTSDGNHTLEGAKFYKKDGYYYILAPAGGVKTGWQLALRSKNVYGPYEAQRVLEQGNTKINGPHQGGLVNTTTGEWWFIHFQDKGAYGRINHLQPVRWIDGWPVMGTPLKNYVGEPVAVFKKPNVGKTYPAAAPQSSDEFSGSSLGLQWSWQANPGQAWAFPSPNGYLRLYGQYHPDDYLNFWQIPNLLLQKLPAPAFTTTLKARLALHNKGDKAGLIMMGLDYGYLAITKTDSGYSIVQTVCKNADQKGKEVVIGRVALNNLQPKVTMNGQRRLESFDIYMKLEVQDGAVCLFSFSTDGRHFQPIGQAFQAREGKWIGAKMGVFILNQTAATPRSWMDLDLFRVE